MMADLLCLVVDVHISIMVTVECLIGELFLHVKVLRVRHPICGCLVIRNHKTLRVCRGYLSCNCTIESCVVDLGVGEVYDGLGLVISIF